MSKRSAKTIYEALLQAEKHSVSDTFVIKDLFFYAKYDTNRHIFIIVFKNVEISFKDASTVLEFIRSL